MTEPQYLAIPVTFESALSREFWITLISANAWATDVSLLAAWVSDDAAADALLALDTSDALAFVSLTFALASDTAAAFFAAIVSNAHERALLVFPVGLSLSLWLSGEPSDTAQAREKCSDDFALV